MAGIYAQMDEIPEFRTRTRHFSGQRIGSRHGEAGAESGLAAVLERLHEICADLGLPMAHVSLAWVAAQPGVSCVLLGSRKPRQLERTLQATLLELSAETLGGLDLATLTLRNKQGSNADYFQGW